MSFPLRSFLQLLNQERGDNSRSCSLPPGKEGIRDSVRPGPEGGDLALAPISSRHSGTLAGEPQGLGNQGGATGASGRVEGVASEWAGPRRVGGP